MLMTLCGKSGEAEAENEKLEAGENLIRRVSAKTCAAAAGFLPRR